MVTGSDRARSERARRTYHTARKAVPRSCCDGEDDQWAYLRNAQAAAACLALSASVADFVSRGGFDYEPF
jgi:hypothetical protein